MKIAFREAQPNDLPKVLEIINYEIEHSTVVYDYTPRTLAMQEAWFQQKQVAKIPVLVAEKDNMVVGFGTYGIFRPWEAYQYSIEHSIYVDKKARGLGIGKQLLQKIIDTATNEGYHTIVAGIDASNEKSIAFHEKVGFKIVGRMNEVGYKFDRWLDLVFMQLFLRQKQE